MSSLQLIPKLEVERCDTEQADMRIEKVMSFNHRIKQANVNKYDMAFSGLLGEIRTARYLGVPLIDNIEYDLIFNGKKVDVKTTIVNREPRPNYECRVFSYNRQKCDYYLFTKIHRDYTPLWICGVISTKEFYKKAEFVHAGTLRNTNLITKDCWVVKISDLHPVMEIH